MSIASLTSFPLPQLSLTAQSVGVPQPVQVGLNLTNGWVKVWNESPFQLQASDGAGAWMHEVSAQAIDAFPLDPGVKLFTLLPIGLIPFGAPGYRVRLALFPDGPPPGSYPQSLARQATPTSQSSSAGFQTSLNFAVTPASASVGPLLNASNSSSSLVRGTFYRASLVLFNITAASVPQVELGWYAGAATSGLTGNVVVANNTTNVNNLVGGSNTAGSRPAGASLWNIVSFEAAAQAPTLYEFIANNDQKEIPPNANIYMFLHNVTTAVAGVLSLFWSEG